MSTNKNSLSTQTRRRKRLIIMGCCLGGVGLIGGGIGIGFAIASTTHKESEQGFAVHCTKPNLVVGEAGTLNLTWDTVNFTPVKIELNSTANSDTKFSLEGSTSTPVGSTLVLSRQSLDLAADVYNVYFTATDAGRDTKVASIAVTISDPVQKDLFFVTGDTQIVAGSLMSIYGTLSASNLMLGADADLQVLVNGVNDPNWSVETFTGQKMIKIDHPTLVAKSKYKIQIRDTSNDNITSNVITVCGVAAVDVSDDNYLGIDSTTRAATTTSYNGPADNLATRNLVSLYMGPQGSSSTPLTTLGCNTNLLSTLDVSHNTALTTLNCYNNSLSTLDVSHNTALTALNCKTNLLSTLDVSHNTALKTLDCYDNSLSTLDVSSNLTLERLECYNNSLSTLDVSHNTALKTLDCYNNSLSTLDVSHNTALQNLYCNNNFLSTLDVSYNTALRNLYVFSNPNLASISLAPVTSDVSLNVRGNEGEWKSSGDIYKNGGNWDLFNVPSGWVVHP